MQKLHTTIARETMAKDVTDRQTPDLCFTLNVMVAAGRTIIYAHGLDCTLHS